MRICGSRKSLWTLTAISALFAATAFSQESCGPEYICFERGEAKVETPADIPRFVAEYHEKLGLTGREAFSCSIDRWIAEARPPDEPSYAYVCKQLFVRGAPAKYLSMRVNLWSRNDGVRSVRCRCVREDVKLPRAKVGRRQAEERGLQFFYARLPEVSPESIEIVDSQDPVIQWDLRRQSPGTFRLARNVRYRFPLPVRQLVTERTHGEVTVSVDALDGSVLRAVGAEQYVFAPGIVESAFEELNKTLAAMPFGEEQFDIAQRFYAFGLRSETEPGLIEQRLKSRARWEPKEIGRFYAFFSDQTTSEQLAAFLEDYDLLMLNASFQYTYGGHLHQGGIEAQTRGGDAPATVARNLFERARARAEMQMSSCCTASTGPLDFAGLIEPTDFRFTNVEFVMGHANALHLYEKERGKRLLTVSPVDRLDNDHALDSF